jgi:hypothetical protein
MGFASLYPSCDMRLVLCFIASSDFKAFWNPNRAIGFWFRVALLPC